VILAGLRAEPDSRHFPGTLNTLRSMISGAAPPLTSSSNTIIGVVMTTARLTKEQVNQVAQMSHDGLARAVHPAHTMYDGDTLFAAATGTCEADVSLVGALAADAVSTAIRRAVREASSLADVKALRDLKD
jgi:L-aminopeptidase/D-esterase-like protein